MKRIIIILCSVLTLIAGFWACDLIVPSEETKAKEELEALKSMVLDEDGKIIFDKALVNGPYQIGVNSIDDATELARLYAGSGFTGEDYMRTLSGGNGTIQIIREQANMYYSVLFDVKDIPSFTLNIKNASSFGEMGSGHSGTYHKCDICGFVWKGASSVCPMKAKHGK